MGATGYTGHDIAARIADEMEDTSFAEKVAEAVKPFDGKQISKRLATAVEKALPGYTVFWDTNYGMFHISVWGLDIPYDARKRYLVGHHSSGRVFSFERFLEHNTCYLSAARERNAKREKLLADPQWLNDMADAINRLNGARADVERLTDYPNPDGSMLSRLAGL